MKVVRLTENDVERLVKKILKEERLSELDIQTFKKEELYPATASIKGERKLVIVDKDGVVQAVGPNIAKLGNLSKHRICQITEKLIAELFDVDESVVNEIDTGEFSDIEPIKFCKK